MDSAETNAHGVNACLTQIQNFSKINPHDKFDNKGFLNKGNFAAFNAALPQTSPKMVKLLETIKAVDAADLARDGHHYKHYVFSDVKLGGSGARIITSAFFAAGFPCAYQKKGSEYDLVVPTPAPRVPNSFVFLPGNTCWGKTLSKNLGKDVTARFNEPDNKYGDYIRFIILDSKYKESIDLNDVKYCHLFDMLNPSDKKQAIGRGARHCGQKNLKYGQGWKLHVYEYNLNIPDEVTEEFDLEGDTTLAILAETNQNLSAGDKTLFPKLMHEIEWVGPTLAVDRALTSAVHVEPVRSPTRRSSPVPRDSGSPGYGGATRGVYRGPITRGRTQREARFAGRETRHTVAENKEHSRMQRAKKLREAEEKELRDQYQKYPLTALQTRVFNTYKRFKINPFPAINACRINPADLQSMSIASLETLQTDIQNQEAPDPEDAQLLQEIKAALVRHKVNPTQYIERKAVQLSNMQKFITAYVTPTMSTKGILMWHSAGSGKTCAAVSMATTNFEPAGYSIVWVTRSNMTRDVQKNALGLRADDIVCAKGGKSATHYSRAWCGGPIGYQTFSNFLNYLSTRNSALRRDTHFLEKYNNSVDEAEARENDPLYKCLIIIDEAHKLYNQELPQHEAPDLNILEKMIQESYEKSKQNSVRVVLMTATPYSYSPFEFFQLMNLLRDKDKLPTTRADLKHTHLTASGKMTPEFIKKFDGYISYADVSRDTSKFAQIEHHTVDVDMSKAPPVKLVTKEQVAAAHALKGATNDDIKGLVAEIKAIEGEIVAQNEHKSKLTRQMAEVRDQAVNCVGRFLPHTGVMMTVKMCAERKKLELIPITQDFKQTNDQIKAISKVLTARRKELKTTKKKCDDAATAKWRELNKTYKKQTGAPDPNDRTQVSALRFCVSRKVTK